VTRRGVSSSAAGFKSKSLWIALLLAGVLLGGFSAGLPVAKKSGRSEGAVSKEVVLQNSDAARPTAGSKLASEKGGTYHVRSRVEVPEPAPLVLVGIGLLLIAVLMRRKSARRESAEVGRR